MDLGLQGKTGLINGGSAGLGYAAAMTLAREGVELFISARGEERLLAACKTIANEAGVEVTPSLPITRPKKAAGLFSRPARSPTF